MPDADEAKAAIAKHPALLGEARMALPALRRYATQPAGIDGVRAVIGNAFGTYPAKARSDGEWTAFWTDYTDALEDVPKGALEAGMRAWKKLPTSMRLPFPGELRQLARSTPDTASEAYNRAYYASLEANSVDVAPGTVLRTATAPQGFLRSMPTDAERDAAAAKAASFRKAHAASKPVIREVRPNHGATIPGRAVTPELRASMLGAADRDGTDKPSWSPEVLAALESIEVGA